MSSLVTQHPEDGVLLRYIDGELPGRKHRQVARHLEACWQCRTDLEDLEGTVAQCVRYRLNVLQEHLPAPPAPWPDIYRGFDRIDVSLAAESWMARLAGWLGSPAVRGWAVAAAVALVLGCGLVYEFRETPAVQAAALLKKAVLAAEARPVEVHRVRFQTRTGKFTRTVGSRSVPAAEASVSPWQARFEAAHYDWDDPLSAKSYEDWRDGLRTGRDEVTTVPDPAAPGENCYQIRTATPEGDLVSASLVLRVADLQPVEGRLEFRDREWVEFSNDSDATTRDDGRPVATNVEPPARLAEPSLPAANRSGPTASISDELRVLSRLHEIGADLGDPVEVQRTEGRIEVSGVAIPAARQKQIRGALDGLPNVAVEFSEPAAAPVPAGPGAPDTAAGGVPAAAIQSRVEQQLGGHAQFQRFSSQVLDRNESLMARVYALRALAQRFPAEAEAGLAAQDRQVLRDMAREHTTALGRDLAGMERALTPVLASMGGSAGKAEAAAGATWQAAAEDLFRAAQRVEKLVSVMLGVTAASAPTDRVPSELLTAAGELRADLSQCQGLLAGQ